MTMYRTPALSRDQISALKYMLKYRWVLDLQGPIINDIISKDVGLPPREMSAVVRDVVDATDNFLPLWEAVTIWEWIQVSQNLESSLCVLSEATFNSFMDVLEGEFPGPERAINSNLAEGFKLVATEQSNIKLAFIDAPMVSSDALSGNVKQNLPKNPLAN